MKRHDSQRHGRAMSKGRSEQRMGRVAIGAAVALAVCSCVGASRSAHADASPTLKASLARSLSLNEKGNLHLTSKRGFTLNEQGAASGTIRGTIYIHLHLVSSSKVTAEVSIYPSSGSLSGTGSATYHVNGGVASFSGTLAINRGSGKYSHARASHLTFTGTIQRRNDAVAVLLSGPLSL
jgi:hypothetical protein